jgi:hypothetical protein
MISDIFLFYVFYRKREGEWDLRFWMGEREDKMRGEGVGLLLHACLDSF